MNIETRKINLINWISTIQEEDILSKVENIQQEASDWWDNISKEDKTAITEGISQLKKGDHLSRSKVRSNIKERFDF
ncbi:MAG: hypothetical protein ACFCUM_15955 [Bacteroidales bacterium]